MLRRNLVSRTSRTAKYDRNLELAARHVEHLSSGVDYLVGSQNREIEGHKLHDRPEPDHGGANAEPCKSQFRYGRIDYAFVAKLGQKAFRNLVRSLIGRNLFAHKKNVFIAQHLFP